MKNFKEGDKIFKNEVEVKELEQSGKKILLKKFYWEEKVSYMTKFIERLEDENIKYAIETDKKSKCQKIYTSKNDKQKVMAKGII